MDYFRYVDSKKLLQRFTTEVSNKQFKLIIANNATKDNLEGVLVAISLSCSKNNFHGNLVLKFEGKRNYQGNFNPFISFQYDLNLIK